MSELYCDRDDYYILTSSQIIREYYFHKQSFLFPNEITLLQMYCQYERAYFDICPQFGIYHVQGLSKEETDILIEYYKSKLKELENSIEMRNFFCRIKEKDFAMSYGNRKDIKSVHDFSQIEEYIKRAEKIIKEKTNVNLALPRYENKVYPENIEKKAISKAQDEFIKERLLEAERQKNREELKYTLLDLFGTFIAPFLILGLLALIAVYIL